MRLQSVQALSLVAVQNGTPTNNVHRAVSNGLRQTARTETLMQCSTNNAQLDNFVGDGASWRNLNAEFSRPFGDCGSMGGACCWPSRTACNSRAI